MGDAGIRKGSVGALTVLIVDDSLTFRCALGDRLRGAGHEIRLASSGELALDALRPLPDAIVLDLEMPGIDGIETCKRIRQVTGGAELPILMLTARDDLPARMQGRAAGASEFLIKGKDFEAVVASVVDFVRRTASGPMSAPPSSTDSGVLARIAAASGLAKIIADTAIVRACNRAGVDPNNMTPANLQRALPFIEQSLSNFLSPEERPARLQAIAAIVKRGPRSGEVA